MNNEININELDLSRASNDIDKVKKILKKVRGYFVDNDYGIKTFLIAIKNNVRLKKEMSTIENESKERLIIFNKILQIKPDLEFKFFDKLIKNFSKIMKNFAEIITMIDKELKSIDEIFSKNATIHILIKNLFSDNVEKDTLNNIIQGIYIELLNVNVKIKIYNDTLNQCKILVESPNDYFYQNSKVINKNVMEINDDIINKIE